MLSLWARTRDFRRPFSPGCKVRFCLKKLNVQFVSSSSHGHASLLPENFEIPTIKIQMKNYRNVKPMALETIYFFKFEYSNIRQQNLPVLPYLIGQSLLYPPVLTVTPGHFWFLHNFAPNYLHFWVPGPMSCKVSRSNLRSRHSFTVRPAPCSALDVMLRRDGSMCGGTA